MRIIIFDSGVGGLTIGQSLTEALPFAEQILLADTAFFPYGEMEEDQLVKRVTSLLVSAVKRFEPDCIVVACNTVSTVALEKIRNSLLIPVIGVVPAIKPAALMSKSKVIGLLATPATVNRSYTADLVDSFAHDCELISVGSTRLVELSEQRLAGQKVDIEQLRQIVQPFLIAAREKQLDVIVLGCTHFPLLEDLLRDILPNSILFIDSSKAIAKQVLKVLESSPPDKLQSYQEHENKQVNRCFMTLVNEDEKFSAGLERYHFSSPEYYSL